MQRENPVDVRFFRAISGREPVREFLKSLTAEERKIAGADLLVIQRLWPVGKPLVTHLRDGIYELRSTFPDRICRILFFYGPDGFVPVHAFIKKTRKCPQDELALAEKRMKEFMTYEEE
jgi:phage-related protein